MSVTAWRTHVYSISASFEMEHEGREGGGGRSCVISREILGKRKRAFWIDPLLNSRCYHGIFNTVFNDTCLTVCYSQI